MFRGFSFYFLAIFSSGDGRSGCGFPEFSHRAKGGGEGANEAGELTRSNHHDVPSPFNSRRLCKLNMYIECFHVSKFARQKYFFHVHCAA